MERLPNGNMLTVRYYASQMVGEDDWRVIECYQEWQNAWPVKDSRKTVVKGLTKEQAEVTARMYEREAREDSSFVDYATRCIEFLTGNSTNRETAENPKLDSPLVY